MKPTAPNSTARLLRAGALSCVLDGPTLGYIRWGDTTLVRLIYGAVRDKDWGTVEPHVSNLEVAEDADAFSVGFDAAYDAAGIDFRSHCRYTGRSDGTIMAVLEGTAHNTFDYARIGLCVLLPWEAYCGRPYNAALNGAAVQGVIPGRIAEQHFIDGCYTPSVPPFTSFETRLDAETVIGLSFEGDEFEMEDQRNWTDSTLKIYSTPLHLGNLHRAERGKRIEQKVRIEIASNAETGALPANAGKRVVGLRIGEASHHPIPKLGTNWPRVSGPGAPSQALIDQLRLSHVRVELDLARDETTSVGDFAIPEDCQIELALWTSEEQLDALPGILDTLGSVRIARIVVNDAESDVTQPALIRAASHRAKGAGCDAPVGGGTDFWFAEINRSDNDFRELDFLSFTISPQLHVFDDASIWESLAIQEQVISAAKRRIANGHIVVSPITLIARDSGKVRRRELHHPDARHGDAFLAAWTAASIGRATAAGAEALTYFDLFGPHGLLWNPASASGRKFALAPAGLVLQAFGRDVGRPHFAVASDDSDSVYAFGTGEPPDRTIVVVNCRPEPVAARLHAAVTEPLEILRLTQQDIDHGSWCPHAGDVRALASGGLCLELSGHEVVRIELGERQQ